MHNVRDFVQILYFAGRVCIINKNNVFHSFFRPENYVSVIFLFVYCLSTCKVVNCFAFVLFGHYPTKSLNVSNKVLIIDELKLSCGIVFVNVYRLFKKKGILL